MTATKARSHITCGATNRRGLPCANSPYPGKRRCWYHGGAPGSGAPKGNQNALKHGFFTKEQRVLKHSLRTPSDMDRRIKEIMSNVPSVKLDRKWTSGKRRSGVRGGEGSGNQRSEFMDLAPEPTCRKKRKTNRRDGEVQTPTAKPEPKTANRYDLKGLLLKLDGLQLDELSSGNLLLSDDAEAILRERIACFDQALLEMQAAALAQMRDDSPARETLSCENLEEFVDEIGGPEKLPAYLGRIDERPGHFKIALYLGALQYKARGIEIPRAVARKATRSTLRMLWGRVHDGQAPLNSFEMAILDEAVAQQRGKGKGFFELVDYGALDRDGIHDRGFVMFQQVFPPPDDFTV
jgi:hypothetical protein